MQWHENPLPPLAHRPIVIVGCFWIGGTWVGLKTPDGMLWSILIGVFLLMGWFLSHWASLRWRRWQLLSSILLLGLIFCVACLSGQWAIQKELAALECFRELEDNREHAVLRGTVVEVPTITLLETGGACGRFRFLVDTIPHEIEDIPIARAPLLVTWYGPRALAQGAQSFRFPKAGEGWQLTGRLREVERPHGPPYTQLTIRPRAPSIRRMEDHDVSWLVRQLWILRGYAESILSLGMEKERAATSLVKAMTLGIRSEMDPELVDVFRNSGTVHVFSISGMHVGFVAAILLSVVSIFSIPLQYRLAFFAPMLIGYTLATGAAPSAVRACTMAIFVFSAPLLGRRRDAFSSMSVAACCLLAYRPQDLMQLGFIFSFICTTGILALVGPFLHQINRPLRHLKNRWMDQLTDPFAVVDTGADTGAGLGMDVEDGSEEGAGMGAEGGRDKVKVAQRKWQRSLQWLVGWIRIPKAEQRVRMVFWFLHLIGNSVAVSLAAWIASTPVSAHVFGVVIPASIVANLVVVPLAALVVFTAVLSLITGIFSPWVATCFNHANVLFAKGLIFSAERFSKLPGAMIEVPSWASWMTVAWYGMALILLLHLTLVQQREQETL